VTLIMRNFIRVADPNPGYKGPFVLGWTGMRGVVSLAAALSIPTELSPGVAFPHRNLILFITFVVILTTLVVQGLTLPHLLRRMNMTAYDKDLMPEEEADIHLIKGMSQHAADHIQGNYAAELEAHEFLRHMLDKWTNKTQSAKDPHLSPEAKTIYIDLLNQQRIWLLQQNRAQQHIDEELVRKHLMKIDLEEERLRYL
jgi:CPA1 family monovalent cation:H+ antiporter